MSRPSPDVLVAFGADGDPLPLPGGRGLAWRVGELVFKPTDLASAQLAWEADVLPTVHAPDVRLSVPQRSVGGELVVAGWTAWSYLPGQHLEGRWLDVVDAGDRLHRALAGIGRPSFIAERTDPWAVGDRVAWGEVSVGPYRDVPHVTRLTDALRPVHAPRQLIHGDLTGNVLFAEGLPPAVIDLSLYWRPAAFATAIVVADALVWEGADTSLLASIGEIDDLGQMLLRALLFRIVAAVEGGFEGAGSSMDDHRRTVDIATDLADRHSRT
jgi:uncharacterized protein (TIGR02569 family)